MLECGKIGEVVHSLMKLESSTIKGKHVHIGIGSYQTGQSQTKVSRGPMRGTVRGSVFTGGLSQGGIQGGVESHSSIQGGNFPS